MAEPNALAYYTEEQITSVKSLITKGQIAEQQEKLEHRKVVWQNRKKLQNIYWMLDIFSLYIYIYAHTQTHIYTSIYVNI